MDVIDKKVTQTARILSRYFSRFYADDKLLIFDL